MHSNALPIVGADVKTDGTKSTHYTNAKIKFFFVGCCPCTFWRIFLLRTYDFVYCKANVAADYFAYMLLFVTFGCCRCHHRLRRDRHSNQYILEPIALLYMLFCATRIVQQQHQVHNREATTTIAIAAATEIRPYQINCSHMLWWGVLFLKEQCMELSVVW